MNNERELRSDSIFFSCADGIRGLACLIVLITHAITMFFLSTSAFFAGSGKIGVCLFFILSAFLLTRKFKNSSFSFSQLINYGISRFLRIIPLYLLALITYRFFGTTAIKSWHNVVDSLLLQQGYAHLWTIPVEFKFYFYLPVLAFLFIKSAQIKLTHSLWLFFIILSLEQIFWPYWQTPINSIEVNFYLSPFTTGVFFAVLYDRLQIYVTPRRATLIGCAAAIICFLSLPISKWYFFKMPLDVSLANQFVYFGFLWAFFIVFTIQGNGVIGKILCGSFFKVIGKWSYSIYLFHWLVYMKFIQLWPNQTWAMLVAFSTAILVGGVVYHFVEKSIEHFRQFTKVDTSWDKIGYLLANRMRNLALLVTK